MSTSETNIPVTTNVQNFSDQSQSSQMVDEDYETPAFLRKRL